MAFLKGYPVKHKRTGAIGEVFEVWETGIRVLWTDGTTSNYSKDYASNFLLRF